jgi:competence protein ComEC
MRATPVAVVLVALALPFRTIERAVVAPTDMTLTLLAVGAGQAAVLETPAGRTVMIDAGSSSLSDVLRKCIGPYLRTRNCTQVDALMLTHADYDHIGAAAGVAQVYDAREVLIGPEFRAHAADNSAAEAMLRSMEQLDLAPRTIARGDRFPLGRDVEVEVLWPPKDDAKRQPPLSSNDSAVVARITYGSRSILITGDIEDVAERELLKHPEQLHADVLIAPHHGSSESTTEAFVAAVNPSVIVSSNDRTLTGKQKRFARLIGERALYRTNVSGAITVRIRQDGSIHVDPYLSRSVQIGVVASTAGR